MSESVEDLRAQLEAERRRADVAEARADRAERARPKTAGEPATPKQIAALEKMWDPSRLLKAEAQFLIGFLYGPPPNMTRKQECFLYGLLRDPRVSKEVISRAIEALSGYRDGTRTLPAAAAPRALPGGSP